MRDWLNLKLEKRIEYGAAAHRNRGRHSGSKVHKLVSEYVVGLVDPTITEPPGTVGATFQRTGKPVLLSCRPVCGCTSGQHAGTPDTRFTADNVNCSKCGR